MRKILGFIGLLFLGTFVSYSQSLERKIIIQNGTFYYVSVDENFQIGTLYAGKTTEKIGMAKAYAVPAGRGISAETNPLAWDINGEDMTAVNFMDHSLNDRNEAIKKFKLSQLKQWGPSVQLEEVVMEGIDQHTYTLNEPYLFIKNRSKYLNHFYFDGVMIGQDYWTVITNNDELTVWQYKGDEWKHGEVLKFPVTGAFNLISHGEKLYLMTAEGALFKVELDQLKSLHVARAERNLTDVILVEDRDQNKFYTLKRSAFNFENTLTELIQKNGNAFTISE